MPPSATWSPDLCMTEPIRRALASTSCRRQTLAEVGEAGQSGWMETAANEVVGHPRGRPCRATMQPRRPTSQTHKIVALLRQLGHGQGGWLGYYEAAAWTGP